MKKKTLAMQIALVLVLALGVGGTLAWLKAQTTEVVNTFAPSTIGLVLTETDTNLDKDGNPNTNAYKMVPGATNAKDPKITVAKGSEPCWVFVKITEENNVINADKKFLEYNIDATENWTELGDGVYYKAVDALNEDVEINVLANKIVTTNSEVTKAEMASLTDYPKIKITAYAIQQEGFPVEKIAKAWEQAQAL